MLRRIPGAALALFAWLIQTAAAAPDKPVWPLTLRDGIPTSLPGWDPAPRDPLPETNDNELGSYTEVSRFFQKIEPSTARQFRIAVQDYGKDKDLAAILRGAMTEAAKHPGVSTAELKMGALTAFAITDQSQGLPTTLVTVIVLPGRIVLGQGSNVERGDAVKLLERVDFAKIAAASPN